MLPRFYYRTCDRCGEVVRIASDDPSEFVCSECGSTVAWEYSFHATALLMQRQVRASAEFYRATGVKA